MATIRLNNNENENKYARLIELLIKVTQLLTLKRIWG